MKTSTKKSLLFTLAVINILLPIALTTSTITQGNQFKISTWSGEQYHAQMAQLHNANLFYVWQGNGAQDGYGIYGKITTPFGVVVKDDFLVNEHKTDTQAWPRLCVLNNGNVVIVFHSHNRVGKSWEVAGIIYDQNGSVVKHEWNVNANTHREQYYPDVAALNNGGFVVVWHSLHTNGWEIYGYTHNADGIRTSGEFRVNSSTANNQHHATVTVFPDGRFLVTWHHWVNNSWGWEVYGRVFNEDSSAVAGNFRISTASGRTQAWPEVSTLSNGNAIVVWRDYKRGGYDRIFGAIVNSSAQIVKSEFGIAPYQNFNQYHPTVRGLSDGSFVAGWYTSTNEANAVLVSNSGEKLINWFKINQVETNNQHWPHFYELESGIVASMWHSNENGVYNVYARFLHFGDSGICYNSDVNDYIDDQLNSGLHSTTCTTTLDSNSQPVYHINHEIKPAHDLLGGQLELVPYLFFKNGTKLELDFDHTLAWDNTVLKSTLKTSFTHEQYLDLDCTMSVLDDQYQGRTCHFYLGYNNTCSDDTLKTFKFKHTVKYPRYFNTSIQVTTTRVEQELPLCSNCTVVTNPEFEVVGLNSGDEFTYGDEVAFTLKPTQFYDGDILPEISSIQLVPVGEGPAAELMGEGDTHIDVNDQNGEIDISFIMEVIGAHNLVIQGFYQREEEDRRVLFKTAAAPPSLQKRGLNETEDSDADMDEFAELGLEDYDETIQVVVNTADPEPEKDILFSASITVKDKEESSEQGEEDLIETYLAIGIFAITGLSILSTILIVKRRSLPCCRKRERTRVPTQELQTRV